MLTLSIRNGRLLDPGIGLDAVGEVVIEDGRIAAVGKHGMRAKREFDATGMLVTPGFIDIHVHLRQPGKENAETVATGATAALAGGFTTIACMPNTTPPIDSVELVRRIKELAAEANAARVEIAACATVGRKGQKPVNMRALAAEGVVGFSDDGSGIADAEVMCRAMRVASRCRIGGLPILDHCEHPQLSGAGVVSAGDVAEELGLPGMPPESEVVMVARDLALAKLTGAHLHIQHVSLATSLSLIRTAKREGIRVSAEVTPHHLTLTDEALRTKDANFKMNPPLRSATDVAALREGLQDGALDCIASDHAPHPAEEKALGLLRAPFGVIGLETSLPVLWTELVETGYLDAAKLILLLATNPARILRLDRGTLRVGAPADVTVIDPQARWRIEPEKFLSKSRNCPFAGREVKGKVVAVVVNGALQMQA